MNGNHVAGVYEQYAIRRVIGAADYCDLPDNAIRTIKPTILRLIENHVVDPTFPHLSPDIVSRLHTPIAPGAFENAIVDPFQMDAFDQLNLLVSFDADHATELNGLGPRKTKSWEAHRLVAQLHWAGKCNDADLRTFKSIVSSEEKGSNFNQISEIVASLVNLPAGDVKEILRSREKSGIIISDRIEACIDSSFNFMNATFIWREEESINLHAARDEIEKYKRFREVLRRSSKWGPLFYGLPSAYSPDAERILNGVKVNYQILRFPLNNNIAAMLVILAENIPNTKAIFDSSMKASQWLTNEHEIGSAFGPGISP